MNETLTHLSQVLPVLAVLAAVFGFLGWSIRGASNKSAPAKTTKPAPASDRGQQDRAKNLEAALEKSKASNKTLKSELEDLRAATVSKQALDDSAAELDAARKAFETETKRISTLETDLKKSQDTIRNLNSRANEGDKTQKDRSFALENELSKARQQIAVLENRPDNSAELNAEIERLRESVAVSTRFAGEMRKREAAAVEALEKAEARLTGLSDSSRAAPTHERKIGPVVDSGRIAAAKAEVIRLVEMNKAKEIAAFSEPVPEVGEEQPVIVEETSMIADEITPIEQDTPVMPEELPALAEEAPVVIEESPATTENAADTPVNPEEALVKKNPGSGELFALD